MAAKKSMTRRPLLRLAFWLIRLDAKLAGGTATITEERVNS